MSTDEFVFLLLARFPIYLLSLFLSVLCITPVIKRTYKGVLDPLFYAIIMASFANAIPFFLFLTDKITTISFLYIFLAESLLWIGFLVFNTNEVKFKSSYIVENESADFKLFFIYFFLLIILKLIAYMLVGIPLFYEGGRLAVYTESGGLGILERLMSFPFFFVAFYSFKLIERGGKYRMLALFSLLVLIAFSILSGSKGAILIIVGGFFYYNFFYKSRVIEFKKFIKYIPLLLIIPILILFVEKNGTGFDPLIGLLFRFVANGDGYYMSFPYDVINTIHINNKFTYLFSGILSPSRLIDITKVDTVIGYQLNWDLHPSIEDGLSGPNTRIPILSWIFYKWGGLLFSFCLGVYLSFNYNIISRFFSKGIINFAIISYLQFNFLVFITDPVLGFGYLFDLMINLFIFFFIYFFVNKRISIVSEDKIIT